MSQTELNQLQKLSKAAWKKLANADQEDAEELATILKDTLEALDQIEQTAAEGPTTAA